MNNHPKTEDIDQEQEIIDLVIARLKTMPNHITLSIGGAEALTASDMIQHIRDKDELGRSIVEMQLSYLRSLSQLISSEGEAATRN